MILIGQYDSPFVRRTALALRFYDFSFEHRPWSTFGDADQIAPFNPLRRVPTLILDDGEVLIESGAILDYLDECVGPTRALMAQAGAARRVALKVCALATGLADKAVSLVYESVLHRDTSELWVKRCQSQIADVLDVVEADRAARPTLFWFGDRISHADIAMSCAVRFTHEAHPAVFDARRWPSIAAHAARCEELQPFRDIQQPFLPPGD